ncbi:monovalent cation/H+ antiporter complex subunit F [Microcella sp.]|uniref:monovalent cation/H+ antiporter complex subunit F n=1 Tax=Microcella sp. TaxID=1913979 RepID=UPI00255FCB74|nr:monovalent cation/H+ antiporter complex subunit F [Microcella sp.]MBX9470901.1 pesticidal protein Cry26Aa [Microcella sp.]
MIPTVVAAIVIGLLAIAVVLAVVRIVRGPTAGDTAVAGDLIFFAFIGIVAVFGLTFSIDAVIDIILIAAILGFLSILSLARLLQGGQR